MTSKTTFTPTTDDIGTAIRDALDLLSGVEVSEAMTAGHEIDEDLTIAEIDHVDDQDLSNLKIIVRGAVFAIHIVRKA